MLIAVTDKQKVRVGSIVLPFSMNAKEPTEELISKTLKYQDDIRYQTVVIVDSMSDLDGKLSVIRHDVKLVENEVIVNKLIVEKKCQQNRRYTIVYRKLRLTGEARLNI